METEVHVHSRDVASARTLQWLALSLTPGIGAGRGRKLVELFNGIDRLFNAPLTELEGARLPAGAAQSIAMGKSLELAADEFDRTKAFGARLVAQDDPEFPKRLYEIYDPPLVLYVSGNTEVISKYGLAVIGTRHPTPYGTGMAERVGLRPCRARTGHSERNGLVALIAPPIGVR